MSKSDDFKNALYNALKRENVSDKWIQDHLIVVDQGQVHVQKTGLDKQKKKTKHK
tara:strand:+ start:19121 stop:19285 length:165 start_codon:yes stop_codon:yes gene_type:complete